MSNTDFEIARKLGATSFLVFKAVQSGMNTTMLITTYTGISGRSLRNILPMLESSNVIAHTKHRHLKGMYYTYEPTIRGDWKL